MFQFNLSQNMATLLHLFFALLQALMIAFAPITLDQKAVLAGFLSMCQTALGWRGYDLTPAGSPVPNPPTKPQVEAQEARNSVPGK